MLKQRGSSMAKNEFFRFGLKGFVGVIVLLMITAQFVLAAEKSEGCHEDFKLVGKSLCVSVVSDVYSGEAAIVACKDKNSKICSEDNWVNDICPGKPAEISKDWNLHKSSWVPHGVGSYGGINCTAPVGVITDVWSDRVFCCKKLEKKDETASAVVSPGTKNKTKGKGAD